MHWTVQPPSATFCNLHLDHMHEYPHRNNYSTFCIAIYWEDWIISMIIYTVRSDHFVCMQRELPRTHQLIFFLCLILKKLYKLLLLLGFRICHQFQQWLNWIETVRVCHFVTKSALLCQMGCEEYWSYLYHGTSHRKTFMSC